jgi:hypothetical protein
MLKWQDGSNYSELALPICHLYIYPTNVRQDNANWRIVIEDGEYGDGPNLAEKEVPAADMDALKRQAIAFLREKLLETLEIIDNG